MTIDFHTHIFPDAIATQAIPALAKQANTQAALNGTVKDLLQSMTRHHISRSVVCSIATSPKQFQPILDWSRAIASEQIIPLPSVHPASSSVLTELQSIHDHGFPGIKLHPYYQDFFVDEERLLPLFAQCAALGLFIVMHCGYDIGFPREERANPEQIRQLLTRVPSLKLVAAHLGAWQQWEDVSRHLIGEDVYLDLAFVLDFLPREQAVAIITGHPEDRILFGSDSPWEDQGEAVQKLRNLHLPKDLEGRILHRNGEELLFPGAAGAVQKYDSDRAGAVRT